MAPEAPVAPAFLSPIAIAAIAMGDGEIVTRESACRSYGKRKRGSWGKSRPSILDLGADGPESMVARQSCKVRFRHTESTTSNNAVYVDSICYYKPLGTKLGVLEYSRIQ